MKCGEMTKRCKNKKTVNFENGIFEDALAAGYMEMSRINLSLAEKAVASDNEAAELCEQNLRSVDECGN